jgi:chorismate mutase/prephenate dehydratase
MGLDELRRRIDQIDEEIVRLISRRAEVVREVAEFKATNKQPYYAPAREKEIYQRLSELNGGPLPDEAFRAVFREILSFCLALEKPLRVTYLGPEGTFTHRAARSKFGDAVCYLPMATIDEVFSEVEKKRASYGVVPVENSTGGGIHDTLTRFLDSPLKVCGEILYEIHHSLLARCPADQVKVIYSRGQVFRQARRWLQVNMPDVELTEVASTSVGAQKAAEEEGGAAIGNVSLAPMHGLDVLFENIEDSPHNVTRFFVIGDHISKRTGQDKTAILCSVKDKVGALHDLLDPFKKFSINMTKIESFPSPKAAWQYYFFIDFHGHPDEEATQKAIDAMEAECMTLKILGAFPRCET